LLWLCQKKLCLPRVMPNIWNFVIIMTKKLSFAKVLPIILCFATSKPNILTFVSTYAKKIQFCPKYYYRFNQNNIINMLRKNVKK
jgi:hypothetical protein